MSISLLTTLLAMLTMTPPTFAADPADAPQSTLSAADADGRWLVEAERTFGDYSASGAIAFSADASNVPDADAPPHQHAAAAQAWLALGRQLLTEERAEDALAVSRKGIDELGDEYAPPMTRDDTKMKLYAAQDLERQDRLSDAASTSLNMLEVRLSLYQERYEVSIPADEDE